MRSATTMIGPRLSLPTRGAARLAAFTSGALAGRNAELSLFTWLDNDGRAFTAAKVPTNQTTRMIQRYLTVNFPSPVKNRCISCSTPSVRELFTHKFEPAALRTRVAEPRQSRNSETAELRAQSQRFMAWRVTPESRVPAARGSSRQPTSRPVRVSIDSQALTSRLSARCVHRDHREGP